MCVMLYGTFPNHLFVVQHFPVKFGTQNLHIALCRLPQQEEMHGCVGKDAEFWVECAIQSLKKCVKYRVTRHPEKVGHVNLRELH